MEDKTAGEEAPIHIPHHISLQKIAVFLILALVLTAGIAFAVKKLINNEVTPSEIISQSKVPTLVPGSNVTIEPTAASSNETAQGKTYINNTHGYSLQIPADYEVFTATEEAVPENNVGIGSKKEKININIVTDPWTSVCANSSSCEKMRLISLTLMGKNYTAQEYYVNRGYSYASYSFQIESGITTKKKTALFIKADYDQPKNFEEISQILSTFKFTDLNQTKFICPQNGWVNCMPILVTEEAKLACSSEAVEWYKTNCPNFEGVAQ